jgi:O-antigen/teichoic acid export membrane protein
MSLDVTYIVKNSLKFSAIGLLSGIIGLPVSIYVATVLLPNEYGTYGFLSLWLSYAALVSPGILMAGRREIPVYIGKGDNKAADTVQNISLTGELLYTLIPFLAILTASFFFKESAIKLGLVIIAATYLVSQVASYLASINFIRELFGVVLKARVILAILSPVIVLSSVRWLGMYSLLVAPLVGGFVLLGYYLRAKTVTFHFTLDRSEIVRLVKYGIVLQLGGLVYWLVRLSDKTVIAAMLSRYDLGLYTYATMFIAYALIIPTDFGNILQPILWREAPNGSFRAVKRIVVYVALGTAMLIPLAQLFYYLVMQLVTVDYVGSITSFNILSYNIYLVTIVTVPNLILSSSVINRQNVNLLVYVVGLVLQVSLSILVVKLGYGIAGVALTVTCVQGFIALVLYYITRSNMFTDLREVLKYGFLIILPLVVAGSFYFLHSFLGGYLYSRFEFAGLSLIAQVVVWSLVLVIFYREYLSIGALKPFLVRLVSK